MFPDAELPATLYEGYVRAVAGRLQERLNVVGLSEQDEDQVLDAILAWLDDAGVLLAEMQPVVDAQEPDQEQ